MGALPWPHEAAGHPIPGEPALSLPGSNLCLDLHGDPQLARLVVFSDGNHHMALAEALREYLVRSPAVGDVFYATLPPRLLIEALHAGALRVGNLGVTTSPHVFLSPPAVLARLHAEGRIGAPRRFVCNRGCSLLLPRGNPKAIRTAADLARADVRLFMSNPRNEAVSYQGYAEALRRWADADGIELPQLAAQPATGSVVYGEAVHHREAPQAVADGVADCAIVFHHLALRYTRVFPDRFEFFDLAGVTSETAVISETAVALVGDGGEHGSGLVEFLLGEDGRSIYARHELDAPQ